MLVVNDPIDLEEEEGSPDIIIVTVLGYKRNREAKEVRDNLIDNGAVEVVPYRRQARRYISVQDTEGLQWGIERTLQY